MGRIKNDSLLYFQTLRGDKYVENSKFDEFINIFGVDPRLVLELIQKKKVPVHLLNATLSVQKKKFEESKIK